MKTAVWLVILVVILIGGYMFLQQGSSKDAMMTTDLGTYGYMCDNGSEFTMTPAEDVSEITLKAGSQGMFTGTVRLAKMGDAAHFETTSGQLIVFSGAGEEVRLTVGEETAVCNPVPSTDSPPWNWGDAGEGGGMKQDVALIVSESILGKWQSIDDAKFVRVFKEGAVVEDWYDNEMVTSGLWVAFEKGVDAPEVPFPMEENAVYIQMTMQGTQADTLNFKLSKLTPEELELIYMDRGGALRFKSIE